MVEYGIAAVVGVGFYALIRVVWQWRAAQHAAQEAAHQAMLARLDAVTAPYREGGVSEAWLQNYQRGRQPSACVEDAHMQPVTTQYDGERIAKYRQLLTRRG